MAIKKNTFFLFYFSLPLRLKGRTRTATLILQLSAGFDGIFDICHFSRRLKFNQFLFFIYFFTKNFALFFHRQLWGVSDRIFALISINLHLSTFNLTLYYIFFIFMPLQIIFFWLFSLFHCHYMNRMNTNTTCFFRLRFTSESQTQHHHKNCVKQIAQIVELENFMRRGGKWTHDYGENIKYSCSFELFQLLWMKIFKTSMKKIAESCEAFFLIRILKRFSKTIDRMWKQPWYFFCWVCWKNGIKLDIKWRMYKKQTFKK